jgi:hypothetical protein
MMSVEVVAFPPSHTFWHNFLFFLFSSILYYLHTVVPDKQFGGVDKIIIRG